MIGECLLHYRIIETIGQGGMGVVYKALDTRLDRPVAIKILPRIEDQKRKHQFVWEARAAAALRHPNIVVIHDIGSDQGADFIVMEYVPGRPLSDHLANEGLSSDEAIQYAIEIASGLEAAHAAGIVHGDLKPSNILVTSEGAVKLIDFGLARLQQREPDDHSGTYAITGTCGYMSPEQTRGERATVRSDIFSFGAVLYEMVTGRRAFDGNSAASIFAAVLRDEPTIPAPVARNVPPALEAIIERCLRKDPRRRFQHMGDLRLALEEAAERPRTRRLLAHRSWRRTWVYGGLAAVAALLVFLLAKGPSDPETPSMPIPLTSLPGYETGPAWSPDGRQVAFSWEVGNSGQQDIYIIQPGSAQTRRLTTEPGFAGAPAWSPDGRWIAYDHVAPDRMHHSVGLISPLGGSTRTLIDVAFPIGAPNWLPDGSALFVEVVPERGKPAVIWVLWVETGGHRQLTWPPTWIVGDINPAISPDGKILAFCRKDVWHTSELYFLDLKTDLSPAGKPRRMTNFGYVGAPKWTPDGNRVLFGGGRDAVGIWQMDRSGKRVRPVFGTPITAGHPAVGRRPDGHMSLVFTNEVALTSIWRYSTTSGPGGRPVELAPSSRSQSYPRFSHDGRRLAFSSTRTGYEEIWVANADGSEASQLTYLRHPLSEMGHWSPDDSTITFVSQDRGPRQIYKISSSGGPARSIAAEEGVDVGTGWSRDGSAYYYNSLRSGRREVWKVAISGGQSQRMTLDGGHSGFESPRGIFYYRQEQPAGGGRLMRRVAGRDEEVPLGPQEIGWPTMVPAAGGFYYTAANGNDIYFYSEDSGRSLRVFHNAGTSFIQFTISPDRRWFAAAFTGPLDIDLMIMERFSLTP